MAPNRRESEPGSGSERFSALPSLGLCGTRSPREGGEISARARAPSVGVKSPSMANGPTARNPSNSSPRIITDGSILGPRIAYPATCSDWSRLEVGSPAGVILAGQ
jgi:hypothetical protein